MEQSYVNISGGDESSVRWWPWNTLEDVLMTPSIVVDTLVDKYADSSSVDDLNHVSKSIRETFVDNTSLEQMSTIDALNEMSNFSKAIDWLVYLNNRIFRVLNDEVRSFAKTHGIPLKNNLYDMLMGMPFDAEGVEMRDKLFSAIFSLSDVDIEHEHGVESNSTDMGTLLMLAKRHAETMAEMQKRRVLDHVFALATDMVEIIHGMTHPKLA